MEQNGVGGPYLDPGSDKPTGRKKDTTKKILLLAGYLITLSNYCQCFRCDNGIVVTL